MQKSTRRYALFLLVLATLACGVKTANVSHPTGIFILTRTPTANAPELTILTVSDTLNLRDRPDETGPGDSHVLAIMPKGTRVVFLGECSDSWAKVALASGEKPGVIAGWASQEWMVPLVCP